MASICRTKRPRRGKLEEYFSIQFSPPGKRKGQPRRVIWLGFVRETLARQHRSLVEKILEYWNDKFDFPNEIKAQLDELSPAFRNKYQRAGLCGPRVGQMTLADLIAHFKDEKKWVKEPTHEVYRQAFKSLSDFMGPSKPVGEITRQDAAQWRGWLRTEQLLAEATCAKRCSVAKALFSYAVDAGFIPHSPFKSTKSGSQRNDARLHYVTLEDTRRLIDAAQDRKWGAIIGLARYAALRMPSEITNLKKCDIDLTSTKHPSLTVYAPKTNGSRKVPVRKELAPLLEALIDELPEGQDLLLPDIKTSSNLRTGLLRIMKKAGITRWPRLFQNMRASCATEWAQKHGLKNEASWLGHSPNVAARHYLMSSEEAFIAATK